MHITLNRNEYMNEYLHIFFSGQNFGQLCSYMTYHSQFIGILMMKCMCHLKELCIFHLGITRFPVGLKVRLPTIREEFYLSSF